MSLEFKGFIVEKKHKKIVLQGKEFGLRMGYILFSIMETR